MIYRITTTEGVEVGYAENVNYIRINGRNGCFNACEREKAIGIAYKGKPYNLIGHSKIEGVPTVIVRPDSYATHLTNLENANAALEAANAALQAQLAETDEAAVELYEANLLQEETNAEQDEAIIEIYEMIGEITNG